MGTLCYIYAAIGGSTKNSGKIKHIAQKPFMVTLCFSPTTGDSTKKNGKIKSLDSRIIQVGNG